MMPSLSTIKRTPLLAAAVLTAALAPAAARADTTQESTFQDDAYLIDNTSTGVAQTLAQLASLGVSRIRVNVKWSTIAPDPDSRSMPAKFNPLDPGAYPAANWVPYDRLVEYAAADGIGVDFNVTAPGPLWAMQRGAVTDRAADHWYPDAQDFGDFVYALGARYSGSYSPPAQPAADPANANPLTKLLGGLTGGPPSPALAPAPPLPRVNYWSIWNEANQPGWLAPQWRAYGRQQVLNSPRLYRGYIDAAYSALAQSGHQSDTILIGDLAPEGYTTPGAYIATTPMPFIRALYCVSAGYRRLSGGAAAALGCPTSGTAKAFVNANPGLFYATGFAHHPYFFYHPPSYSTRDANWAPLANLGRLEHGLDRALGAYRVRRHLPIYITEYGYSTNPPNPRQVVSPAQQAAYINQAEYMAWRNPRVLSWSQFLLYDSPPNRSVPRSSPLYWDSFQTGLLFINGRPKPAYDAYRTPIWIPSPRVRRGGRMLLWGELRPGPHNVAQTALIQWRGRRGGWTTIATVTFQQPEGYFTTRVRPPGSGTVRIGWHGAGGVAYTSRTVPITVR